MKSNMMSDISSKLTESFQDFVGNLHDFDVEEKLRRIVCFDQPDKIDICCRGIMSAMHFLGHLNESLSAFFKL